MATPSSPPQQPDNVSKDKHDFRIVRQAAEYHRMLANFNLDGDYDDFDDLEEDSFRIHKDMTRYHRESFLARHMKREQRSTNRVDVHLFDIKSGDHLLMPLKENHSCVNAKQRAGLWVNEPNLGLSCLDMGFLSQLAQVCLHAKINNCNRSECRTKRNSMYSTAPDCNWGSFRDWALVAMSCQAVMSNEEKQSLAHTHIATVVSSLCKALHDCRRLQPTLDFDPFRCYLDGDATMMFPINIAQVSNLIYWMAKIQSQIGLGPTKLDRWNHHFLPDEVTLPWIEHAVQDAEKLGLCKNRLWNLVSVSDRKQSDLPDIIKFALDTCTGGRTLGQQQHDFCTPSKCQWAHLNSTSVTQLHKCGQNVSRCTQKVFPIELLETALEMGNSTAWLCEEAKLSGPQDHYIAISHVWSDGTGVGLKDAGTVNSCLFDFFTGIAKKFGCKAIWWDALSIPSESKARSKALNMMHSNYSNAQCTIVHDNALLNFPWNDAGSACLALVLSTWFTRGWTALELSMSKTVKVLFKNPGEGEPFVIKDLDTDILAQSPGSTSRAHWLATTLVRRLRRPVNNVGDLLAILTSRSTSWVRDRTVIAALLAGVPDCDFNLGESLITIKILQYLGRIPYFCLFHGKPTLRNKGPYSWCAATLDDMPVDTSADFSSNTSRDLLEINESGFVDGHWYCHTIDGSSMKSLKAYGNDLAAVVKVNVALAHWQQCLLLHPSADRHGSLSLLVIPITVNEKDGILECRYIGTVVEDQGSGKSEPKHPMLLNIRIGADEPTSNEKGIHAEYAINKMAGKDTVESDKHHKRSDSAETQPFKPPDWLKKAKTLEDLYQRGLEPLQAELMTNLDADELFEAIRTRKQDAALYLVGKGASLPVGDTKGLIGIFKRFKSGEEACASMKVLGDVYFKANQLLDAIAVYKFVAEEYVKIEVKSPLRPLLAKYSLAITFVRGSQQVRDAELRERFQESAASLVSRAEVNFRQILEACEKRAQERGETRSPAQNKGAGVTPGSMSPTLLQQISALEDLRSIDSISNPLLFTSFHISGGHMQLSAKTHSQENKAMERVDGALHSQIWYQLELNVIAELTLLLTTKEDFDGAAVIFQRAFRKFGSLPDQDVEGFNLQTSRRDELGFTRNSQRDEQAAVVYQRALKQFDAMFHGNHLLIFLTSFHLGVNHLLRSKFSSAEVNLLRALEGFVARLSPSKSGTRTRQSALWRTSSDETIIIGLTRYYLGTLFRNQDKLQEAKKQLEKAQEIASRLGGPEGQTLNLLISNELGNVFLQRLKSEGTNDQFFSSARRCFQDATRGAEGWLAKMKGGTVASERVQLAMNRLSCLSFANFVLLHLEYGTGEYQLPDETIPKFKKLVANYGEAYLYGYPRELEMGDKKAKGMVECEARRILGLAYTRQKDFPSAEIELGMAWRGYEYLYGGCHLQTLDVCVLYADVLSHLRVRDESRREEAETLLEMAVKRYDQTVGSYHSETLLACLKLGQVYSFGHKFAEAEKIYERAYHGFQKTSGPGHIKTARAARSLGDLYFEKGTLGKACEMYRNAYSAFSNISTCQAKPVSSQTATETGVVPTNDILIETLQATMDYAKVCALIRTTTYRDIAIGLYESAIKGFVTLGDDPLAVTSKLAAHTKLGALYGESRNFSKGREHIEKALHRLRTLLDQGPEGILGGKFERFKERLDENLLEAQLKLDLLKLNELRRAKNNSSDFKTVRKSLQDTHNSLVKLLGKDHMLTLEAYTALAELYLDGHGGSKPGHDPAAGREMLLGILRIYGPHGNSKLALGHPKRVHIMDRLINCYEQIGLEGEVDKMTLQLWGELEQAYGFDQAVLMIDATSGSKHTARCINFDKRFRDSWVKSKAYSKLSSLGTGLSTVAKSFGVGKSQLSQSISSPAPGPCTTMSGAVPTASLSNPTSNTPVGCIASERSAAPKRPHPDSGASGQASSSAAGSVTSANDSHYDGSQKRRKFLGKLKEAGGKLKEAGRDLKEAGKVLRQ